MSNKTTLEQVEQLAAQLAPQEQLALVARICEKLSAAPLTEQTRLERLQLAEELLAEVAEIEDDSQGESDAAEAIRGMRDARLAQICQKDA